MQKYIKRSWSLRIRLTLTISNNEIEYIIKIVKSLEDSDLLLKARRGEGINRAGEGIVRAGYGSRSSKMNF